MDLTGIFRNLIAGDPMRPDVPFSMAPKPQGSGYEPDRLGAFVKGYGDGGLLGAIAGATTGSDRQQSQANATYEFLVRRGVAENDARALISNPALMQQVLPALMAPKTSKLGPGETLIDNSGKVIFSNQDAMKPTNEQSNFEFARKNGYAGTFDEFLRMKESHNPVSQTPEQRASIAKSYGVDPNSDAGRSYILTGRLPREDQQMLTATDKKAILEADEQVQVNQQAIDALTKAKELSPHANQGWFAAARATLSNNLPDMLVPDVISSPESGQATSNLDNAVVGSALTQLKSIFGGNPTEGERKILLELQGSSSQPDAVRQDIYNRALYMAQKRLEFNRQRAVQLRGGTFFKPQGSGQQQRPAPAGLAGSRIRAKNASGDVIEWDGNDWVPVQ